MPSSGLRPGSGGGSGLSADYEAALGKYTEDTPVGDDGLYDPASTNPADGGWLDIWWGEGGSQWTWGAKDGSTTLVLETVDLAGVYSARVGVFAPVGTSAVLRAHYDEGVSLVMRMNDPQSASPLVIKDSADAVKFEVEETGAIAASGGAVGFYGTTPIAKQTGVAVTTGGIHAALVALGLIAA